MLLWIEFIICSGLILYSGSRLSLYGDIIAEKTGLGRTWIGIILLATVTSLPELITEVSSVTYADVPDIAVGQVIGSCTFNMLIFALLDAFHRTSPITSKAQQGNILSAGFGILLLSITAISLFLKDTLPTLAWIGPYTIILIIIYLIAIHLIFYYEKRQISTYIAAIEEQYKDISKRTAYIKFTINALIIIIAATFLPMIGEGIAETTGLGQTFVGNIFIALTTSLPEVVVSLTAIRIGAVDLAISNIFGSNIFNIAILAIGDIFFIKGHILSFANANNIISALSAISMTVIAIIGIVYRASKRPLFLSWDSIAILLVFIGNLMLLYILK